MLPALRSRTHRVAAADASRSDAEGACFALPNTATADGERPGLVWGVKPPRRVGNGPEAAAEGSPTAPARRPAVDLEFVAQMERIRAQLERRRGGLGDGPALPQGRALSAPQIVRQSEEDGLDARAEVAPRARADPFVDVGGLLSRFERFAEHVRMGSVVLPAQRPPWWCLQLTEQVMDQLCVA